MSSDTPGSLSHRIESLVTPLAQLVTRVVFGQAFLITGLSKLNGLDATTKGFTELGLPFAAVLAPMVAVLEFAGGILLFAGLGTRTVALLLTATMVVATGTAHGADLLESLTLTRSLATVPPLPFLVAAIWLLAKGPGAFSLDHALAHRKPPK
ncbi:MAG: DoxX family protein [Planctomycetes bacterium]|nr:DoxX family protein [Planctomycetota bacterium]